MAQESEVVADKYNIYDALQPYKLRMLASDAYPVNDRCQVIRPMDN